ncbi:autotransporter outer membrane beta-barrel domain-containing protein [Acinetobacter sp. WZC-1]|uniref:autotransporter outer membrane beta-barrel domain-containing protein n=1 Tax=Acinetobacter sp. WZC-1 TaxID=3459034 RepID=UPI00403DD63D
MSNKNRRWIIGQQAGFRFHQLQMAILLVLGAGVSVHGQAENFINYDGSVANNLRSAVMSWENAPEFQANWGLAAMKAQYAYAQGLTGRGVTLGAVDSGYLVNHEEFQGGNVHGVGIEGTYDSAGSQYDRETDDVRWEAGQAFGPVQGSYIEGINDNHGNHVSGTIVAAKNGTGILGVAFDGTYYVSNTNGTDGSIYGSNMDYNYFKAAYGNLAKQGVRVINSSWGSPPKGDNYDSVSGVVAAYIRLKQKGAGTWLDAAADVAQEYNVLQVWANGNAGVDNSSIRAILPYFRPELEQHWIAVSGLNQEGGTRFNRCGVAKYWCVAAPGVNIVSANIAGNDQYKTSSGTSMSAPHVTGAVGVLMQRYPYLGNNEIRTILLTTSAHQGEGAADLPNETFGWGVPDLQKGLNGPGQLLGDFVADLPENISDHWSNPISDAALRHRQQEEVAEIAGWSQQKAALEAQLSDAADQEAISNEIEILQARIDALKVKTEADYSGSLNKAGAGILTLSGMSTYSGPTLVTGGVLRAGAENAFSPNSAMNVHSAGTLDLAGYSQQVASVTNAGVISMAAGNPSFLKVTGPWQGGNGLLRMNVATDGTGDQVILSGTDAVASGETRVSIENAGTVLGKVTTGSGIEVVGTESGARIEGEAFRLAGSGYIDGGAYRYRLNNIGTGSYLGSSSATGQTSYRPEVSLFLALPQQLYQSDMTMLGSRSQRMGNEVNASSVQSAESVEITARPRLWGRFIASEWKTSQQGLTSPDSNGEISGFQTGVDLFASDHWRQGFYIGQLLGDASVSGVVGGLADQYAGKNDLRNKYVGSYLTYHNETGFYVDGVVQAGWSKYSIHPQNMGYAGKGRSLLTSVEAGQEMLLAGNWWLEPQLQVIYTHQRLKDLDIAYARVAQDSDNSWTVRGGLQLKNMINTPVGLVQPYGQLNVYHQFDGASRTDFATQVGSTATEVKEGGTRMELVAGLTVALNDSTGLYGEIGRLWSVGGEAETDQPIRGSLGVRASW